MKAGKLAHRAVSPEQATLLRAAIANYRKAKKPWEHERTRLNGLSTPKLLPRRRENYADYSSPGQTDGRADHTPVPISGDNLSTTRHLKLIL